MDPNPAVHLLDDHCELLTMDELTSITAGVNHTTAFILWVLLKNQAADEMAAFYATQHAH
jgi:hypothetical protein